MINFESDEKRREFFEKLTKRKAEISGLEVYEEDEKVIPEISYGDIFDALSLTSEFIAKSFEELEEISALEEIKEEKTRTSSLASVDSVAIKLPLGVIGALTEKAEEFGIKEVVEDLDVFEFVDESVKITGVDPDLWDMNLRGKGIKIAVLDTGVEVSHPDLISKTIITKDLTYTEFVDETGHGTHLGTTIVGNGTKSDGKYKGVAPEAELYVGKVLSASGGKSSWIILGLEWALEEGVDLINLSLGTKKPSDGENNLCRAVNNVVDEGIAVFCAAGNSGRRGAQTIGAPAAAFNAITIGASTCDDKMAEFSSEGPIVGDKWIKPDLSVPGRDIVAGLAGGLPDKYRKPEPKYEDKPILSDELGEYYTYKSGTSMATPIATGIGALLLESYFGKYGAEHRTTKKEEGIPLKLKTALMETVKDLKDENGESYSPYKQGKGRIKAKEALDKFLGTSPSLDVTPSGPTLESPKPSKIDIPDISEITNKELLVILGKLKKDTFGNKMPLRDRVLLEQLRETMIQLIDQLYSTKQKRAHYGKKLTKFWKSYEQLKKECTES
jgi:subtilisin family serine protease